MSNSAAIHGATHQWTDDQVILAVTYKRGQRDILRQVKIELAAFGIKRYGLLEACIDDAECPLQQSVATHFAACVKAISKDGSVAKLLSTPPNQLTRKDIIFLFRKIDNFYLVKNVQSSAALAEQARNIIRDGQAVLQTGITLAQVGYKTSLKVPPRRFRKDISDRVDIGAESTELQLPLSAETKSNVYEFTGNSEEHYRKRLERIVKTCEEVLDEHDNVKRAIDAARRMPLPKSLRKKTIKMLTELGRIDEKVANRRTAEERLIIALKIIDHHELYSSTVSGIRVYIEDIPLLDRLSGGKGARTRFGVLLSSHYLSRYVVTACFIILLRYTGWNSETLIGLSADRIRRTAHGYQLFSLKEKTQQYQESQIISDDLTTNIEEKAAVRAISLLLWHNSSVDKLAVRHSKSIFVSFNLSYKGKLEADVFLHGKHFHEFTSFWNLPRFTAADIRTQTIRHDYLKSGGDLAAQQATVGHANSATTRHYLGGLYTAHNEANIKRYCEMLGHVSFTSQIEKKSTKTYLTKTRR